MLRDLRVLDLCDERGFLAGKILGDLGADVVKVERPGGDESRDLGPFLHDEAGRERSLPWLALNTSKRGITLDLEVERGRELFLSLVAEFDVVLESFAPGQLDLWALGFEALQVSNSHLIQCAITPFGQDGPWANYQGHDLVVVAMGGNAATTGDPDRPPVRCSMPTSTYHAAPEAVMGILMALHAQANQADRGVAKTARFVDVSMHECQLASLITGAGQYQRSGNVRKRSGGRMGGTREIWQAKDGWISFGLRGGPARIPNLIATVEVMKECGVAPKWLVDYDWKVFSPQTMNDEEIGRLEEAFGRFFRTKTMHELYETALERRILLAPCNDAREILAQAQLRDRELFVTLDYPELGARIEHPDFFAKSDAFEICIRRRAPRIGEHNDEVYASIGLGGAQCMKLRAEGVI